MKRKPAFATEAALCEAFLAGIDRQDWTPYAETAGWDVLLVRKYDGLQIGIQAKLRLNPHVMAQALEGRWSYIKAGPDCRAVLVPAVGHADLEPIADHIGLTIITMRDHQNVRPTFWPVLPRSGDPDGRGDWHEWAPPQRHKLPEYVPDVVAGSPAPVQLTGWKIAAIKLAVTLERRGFVTREDFKHLKLDHRRWVDRGSGWLRLDREGYIAGQHMPDFKRQHPKVYEQIASEAEKWMRKPEEGDLFS